MVSCYDTYGGLGIRKKEVFNSRSSNEHLVYLIHCNVCRIKYVGSTIRSVFIRISEHIDAIEKNMDTLLYDHFTTTHRKEDFRFCVLHHCSDDECVTTIEDKYIRKLDTKHPNGLNMKYASRYVINDKTSKLHYKLSV